MGIEQQLKDLEKRRKRGMRCYPKDFGLPKLRNG